MENNKSDLTLPIVTIIIGFLILVQIGACSKIYQNKIKTHHTKQQIQTENAKKQNEEYQIIRKDIDKRNMEIYEAKKLKDSLDDLLLQEQIKFYKKQNGKY